MEIANGETEYKFQARDEEALKEIETLAVIGAQALHATGRKHLTDVYLETPGLRLSDAGLSLRVRKLEDGTSLLTLKRKGSNENGLHIRAEIEEKGDVAPGIGELAAGKVREELLRAVGDKKLQTLVAIPQERSLFELRHKGRPWAELSLDRVAFGSEETPRHFFVELEAKRKKTGDLLDQIAHELQKNHALCVDEKSKLEWALGETRLQSRAQEGPPRADVPAHAFVRWLAAKHLAALLVHEKRLLEAHSPDAIHKLRVAARRLRALLDAFGNLFRRKPLATFRRHLRRLGRVAGKLRDFDVFNKNWEQWRHPDLPETTHLVPPSEFERARERLLAFLASAEHEECKRRLRIFCLSEEWGARSPALELPFTAVAPQVMRRQWENVLSLGDGLDAESHDHDLHALRISMKKMRYCLESAAAGMSMDPRWIEGCKTVQDHLGDLNDCAQGQRRAGRIAHGERDSARKQALGSYRNELRRRARELRGGFPAIWERFLQETQDLASSLQKS